MSRGAANKREEENENKFLVQAQFYPRVNPRR